MPLLALITGPFGKIAGIAAVALGLFAAGALALHQHDARVRAEQLLAEEKVQAEAIAADQRRTVAALEAQASEAAARADQLMKVRSSVHAAPVTTGCADRPAIRAALDGLRRTAVGGPGAAAGGAGVAPPLPGSARAAGAGSH